MARSTIPRLLGDDFQDYYFWDRACELFEDKSHAVAVTVETRSPRGFDDVSVEYDEPILDGAGLSARSEHIQVKFHVTAEHVLTWESLIDPEEIGASKVSFLERLRDAVRDSSDARFVLATNCSIDTSNALAELVRHQSGEINTDLLLSGKTRRHRIAAVRLMWMERLGVSNADDLIKILKPLRIHARKGTLDEFKRHVSQRLAASGLPRIDFSRVEEPYLAIIQRLRRAGRDRFDRASLTEEMQRAGIVQQSTLASPEASRAAVEKIFGTALQQTLALIRPLETPPTPEAAGNDAINQTQIDVARDLITAGEIGAARSLLLKLKQVRPALSPNALFRVEMNLGACALAEWDGVGAERHLSEARALQLENIKALLASGQAALMRDHVEEALDFANRARKLEPRNAEALALQLQSLDAKGDAPGFDGILTAEPWGKDELPVLMVLAWRNFHRDAFEEAEQLFRRVLSIDRKHAPASLLLGFTILSSVEKSQTRSQLLDHLDPALRTRLSEADDLITAGLGGRADQGSAERRVSGLVARGRVRAHLGRHADALADADEALRLITRDARALTLRALTLLDLGRTAEAVSSFMMIEGPSSRAVALPLADALLKLDRVEEAERVLSDAWSAPLDATDRPIVLVRLDEVLRQLGRESAAAALLADAQKALPDDPHVDIVLARAELRGSNLEQARHYAERARASFKKLGATAAVPVVAALFAELGDHASAADLYGSVASVAQDAPLTRRYLDALFKAGRYRECLAIASSLRAGGPPIAFVSEIEAAVRDYCGDTPQAFELWRGLTDVDTQRWDYRVRSAQLAIRLGNTDTAQALIDGVKIADLRGDAEVLLDVARLRLILGLPDPLAFAYEAVRRHSRTASVLGRFFLLFLAADQREPMPSPVAVEPGTGVVLDLNGTEQTFVLLRDGEVPLLDRELPPTDALALALRGHAVEDVVPLGQPAGGDPQVATIRAVLHPYAATFRIIGATLPTRFPGQEVLASIKVDEGDVSPILAAVEQRDRLVSAAVSVYREGRLTIEILGRLTGHASLETWGYLVGARSRGILMSRGGVGDLQKDAVLLHKREAICLDVLALRTLDVLGLLPRVAKSYRLLTTQALLDDLGEQAARIRVGPKPSGVIGREDGRFVFQEVGPDDLEAQAKVPEHLLTFSRSEARSVPTYESALSLDPEALRRLVETFGASAIFTALAAREHGAVMVSDDVAFREVAAAELGTPGVSSQSLLLALLGRGTLSEDEYLEALTRLATLHYHFLSLRRDDVLHLISRASYKATPPLAAVLSGLEGPECSDETGLPILAVAIEDVYRNVALPELRNNILDLLIRTATTGRAAESTLRVLLGLLKRLRVFRVSPFHLEDIAQRFELWRRVAGGIILLG